MSDSDEIRDVITAAVPAMKDKDAMRVIEEDFGHPAHLPRAGAPQEIGPVIVFVGSKRNSYMTGANVNVDGGSDFC